MTLLSISKDLGPPPSREHSSGFDYVNEENEKLTLPHHPSSELSRNRSKGVETVPGRLYQQHPGGRKQGMGLHGPLLSSAWCWGPVAVTVTVTVGPFC